MAQRRNDSLSSSWVSENPLEGKEAQLCHRIDIEHTALLQRLKDDGVLNQHHIDDIESETTELSKVKKLLKLLPRCGDFLQRFCYALYYTRQEDIVDDFFPQYTLPSIRREMDQLTAARKWTPYFETLEDWLTAARDWRGRKMEIWKQLKALRERESKLERELEDGPTFYASHQSEMQDSVTSIRNNYRIIRFTGNDIHDYIQSKFSSRNDVWQEMNAERETLIFQSRNRQNQLTQLDEIITTEVRSAIERGDMMLADRLMRDITAKIQHLEMPLGVGEMQAIDLRERMMHQIVCENEEMMTFVGLLNYCSHRPRPIFGVTHIIKA